MSKTDTYTQISWQKNPPHRNATEAEYLREGVPHIAVALPGHGFVGEATPLLVRVVEGNLPDVGHLGSLVSIDAPSHDVCAFSCLDSLNCSGSKPGSFCQYPSEKAVITGSLPTMHNRGLCC